jgi:hypothetical protein
MHSRVHDYGDKATIFRASLDQAFVIEYISRKLCQLKFPSSETDDPVLKQPALDDEPDHPHRYPFAHGWLH